MALIKRQFTNIPQPAKAKSFTEMVKVVPTHLFDRMVARAGITGVQARELCQAFKELKK